MPVSAETLAKLIAAGLSGQELIDVVASIDRDHTVSPKERTAHALRQERYRRRKASQSVTNDGHSDADLPSEGSSSPTPPSLPNQPSTPPISPPVENRRVAPQIVLQSTLDPMTAKRWADHCGRMSEETAQAHVAALRDIKARGGNPVDAVALAIKRGWRTLELEWLIKAGLKLASPQPVAQFDWSAAMQVWRDDETWSPMWGPKPGERGCRVPAELLRESAA